MREIQELYGPEDKLGITGKVIAVVFGPDGKIRRVIEGKNIVSNDGDMYYAQMAAGEAPDDDFDAAGAGLRLGSDDTAPTKPDTDVTTFIASTGKAVSAGYPKTADADANNSGGGVDIITWMFEYSAGDFTAAGIKESAIVDDVGTPTVCLCHFLFAASFDIVASEALTVFVNHEFLGA